MLKQWLMKAMIMYIYLKNSLQSNYILDIRMGSPPPNNLQGASRVTGGVICGHALGNVFNLADFCDLEVPISPIMGKVYLYDSHVDPSTTKPNSAIKLKVTTYNLSAYSSLKARRETFSCSL